MCPVWATRKEKNKAERLTATRIGGKGTACAASVGQFSIRPVGVQNWEASSQLTLDFTFFRTKTE